MPRVKDAPLNQTAVGSEVVISRVNTHDAEKLSYLNALGLRPGASLQLVAQAPFNGPLQVRVGSDAQLHHLGHELAGVLRVCSAEQFALV
jgi:Fe2+ transport system protein FeoA